MRIFDIFKKIAKENKVEEIVIEKLTFSEIEEWVQRKMRENELKQKEILYEVGVKIESFIEEFRGKILILKDFDIEAKKEKEQIKNIVNNSREKYIESVENLIEKLSNLREPILEKYMGKINKIFFDFNKNSFKNYERATILIGKEMASIKESLKVFSKDVLKIFEEGKLIIHSFKNFLNIKEKLDTIIHMNKTIEEISEKKFNLNKKISGEKEEKIILKDNLEEIKKSPSYLENLSKKKKIKSLREESKKDILELKQLLDFKALANYFHINPEQMKIVKNHKEDFYSHFINDYGKLIISLIDEAKLKNEKIVEKIKMIHSKLDEIENDEKNLKEDETQEIYSKIKDIRVEIDNLEIDKAKEEKRGEKLNTSKEELMGILNQELAKLNVKID